ncbi:MAG: hypothetical protein ACJAW3_000889 [Lentimonas sp.]|jgi:hypothetical protein
MGDDQDGEIYLQMSEEDPVGEELIKKCKPNGMVPIKLNPYL